MINFAREKKIKNREETIKRRIYATGDITIIYRRNDDSQSSYRRDKT
jgi:hypothetical protein